MKNILGLLIISLTLFMNAYALEFSPTGPGISIDTYVVLGFNRASVDGHEVKCTVDYQGNQSRETLKWTWTPFDIHADFNFRLPSLTRGAAARIACSGTYYNLNLRRVLKVSNIATINTNTPNTHVTLQLF